MFYTSDSECDLFQFFNLQSFSTVSTFVWASSYFIGSRYVCADLKCALGMNSHAIKCIFQKGFSHLVTGSIQLVFISTFKLQKKSLVMLFWIVGHSKFRIGLSAVKRSVSHTANFCILFSDYELTFQRCDVSSSNCQRLLSSLIQLELNSRHMSNMLNNGNACQRFCMRFSFLHMRKERECDFRGHSNSDSLIRSNYQPFAKWYGFRKRHTELDSMSTLELNMHSNLFNTEQKVFKWPKMDGECARTLWGRRRKR